jgi:FkbH-like protein
MVGMDRPSYSQIAETLRTAAVTELPPLRIAVLRNIVLEPIEAYLRYLALEIGLNAEVRFGQYDNVVQEALGGCPDLLNDATDCVLVFLQLETLARDLVRNPLSLDTARIEGEKARIRELVTTVLQGIRNQTRAMVLWHAFERPLYPALGVLDYQDPDGQTAVVHELNDFLRDHLRSADSAYLVDVNVCVARIGARQFYDPRYWHIGKAPYSRDGLAEIASEAFKYLRPLRAKSRKCVVLDCDGVLWGGILGEDGVEGIKLGANYPGSMYSEVQQELLNLHNRGVLLALCSKNNEDEVWDVFQRHPGMVLRREHIATAQINWRDKVTNLRQIAIDLGLGLDAFVFIDDSEVEVDLVRQLLPDVYVLHFPAGRAAEHRDRLASCGLFESLAVSPEDRRRTSLYHEERARQSLRAESTDLEAYYRSLEMVLQIRFADPFAIPRIAQLTQKTNQFNLTTRRYAEADIKRLSDLDGVDVIAVRLTDRFGDAGVIGTCILTYQGAEMTIDTFLLSCRVLGRGVEDAVLVQCLKRARLQGCHGAIGEYRPTSKNGQTREFYPRHGFAPVPSDGSGGRFRLDLTSFADAEPAFFKRIDSEIAPAAKLINAADGVVQEGTR